MNRQLDPNEAFFEIQLQPKVWPENWGPTRLDCSSAGINEELLLGAISKKVLEAFND